MSIKQKYARHEDLEFWKPIDDADGNLVGYQIYDNRMFLMSIIWLAHDLET